MKRVNKGNKAMKSEKALKVNFQRYAVAAVFTLTCFTVPVLQASGASASGPAMRTDTGSQVQPGMSDGSSGSGGSGSGGSSGSSGSGVNGGSTIGTENRVEVDWSKGALADQIKVLQQQFKQQQKDLIQKYQELLKAAKDASKDEREKIRSVLKDELKAKLDELITKQKELRSEIKQGLEDHKELVDAAKEKAKEKVRDRRGNGGN